MPASKPLSPQNKESTPTKSAAPRHSLAAKSNKKQAASTKTTRNTQPASDMKKRAKDAVTTAVTTTLTPVAAPKASSIPMSATKGKPLANIISELTASSLARAGKDTGPRHRLKAKSRLSDAGLPRKPLQSVRARVRGLEQRHAVRSGASAAMSIRTTTTTKRIVATTAIGAPTVGKATVKQTKDKLAAHVASATAPSSASMTPSRAAAVRAKKVTAPQQTLLSTESGATTPKKQGKANARTPTQKAGQKDESGHSLRRSVSFGPEEFIIPTEPFEDASPSKELSEKSPTLATASKSPSAKSRTPASHAASSAALSRTPKRKSKLSQEILASPVSPSPAKPRSAQAAKRKREDDPSTPTRILSAANDATPLTPTQVSSRQVKRLKKMPTSSSKLAQPGATPAKARAARIKENKPDGPELGQKGWLEFILKNLGFIA